MPRDLHPSLSPGPEPLPVCLGCHTTSAPLAAIPASKTMFLCLPCASLTALNALAETARQVSFTAVRAASPEVSA